MSATPLLLRMLLCLVLIVTGTGTTFAATRMAVAQPTQTAEPASSTGQATHEMAKSHCADREAMGSTTAGGHDAAVASDAGKLPAPDCCKGDCGCACLQATPAAFAVLSMPAAVIGRAMNVRPVNLVYRTPALPNVIRPPIG
jgi:hypothetical protein